MSCFSTHAPPPTTSTLAMMAVRITSLRQAGSGREAFSYPRAVSASITDASFASGRRLTGPQPPKPRNPTHALLDCLSATVSRRCFDEPQTWGRLPAKNHLPAQERARESLRRASTTDASFASGFRLQAHNPQNPETQLMHFYIAYCSWHVARGPITVGTWHVALLPLARGTWPYCPRIAPDAD